MCAYIYIYIYIHARIHIYIYIYTVGLHNFNLRIFNFRVSNPNKLIVDVFFDTMSDFNVPGFRPQKQTLIFENRPYNIYIYIYIYIM